MYILIKLMTFTRLGNPADPRGFTQNFWNQIHFRFEMKFLDESFLKPKIDDITVYRLSVSYPIPKNANLGDREQMSIYCWHQMGLYRGWRYIRSLPSKGQRTWTNAWSAFRCNVLLRAIILRKGKSFYGNLHDGEIFTAWHAELVNDKWREQWNAEWEAAKRFRIKKKKEEKKEKENNPNYKKSTLKIDLYSMACGAIVTRARIKKLTKKQKAQHNFNAHALGYETGFSKAVLRRLYWIRKKKAAARLDNVILNKNDLKEKKKKANKKKKSNDKVKKNKNEKIKKTKQVLKKAGVKGGKVKSGRVAKVKVVKKK